MKENSGKKSISQIKHQMEIQKLSDDFKATANQFFSTNKYDLAIDSYSSALLLTPSSIPLLTNRSLAHYKLELYQASLQDADAAIALDEKCVKAYFRKAMALVALNKLKEAIGDFKIVVKLEPTDGVARAKLSELVKRMRREAFEAAIFCDDTVKSAFDRLGEIDSMAVDSSYKGPHLGEEITLDFVLEMMELMKKEGRLDRKYVYQILKKVQTYLLTRPTIEDITIPAGAKMTICGDIHGQFFDLMHIFEINGLPSDTNLYLFNGDFVDRGAYSVECIMTLFSFKLLYPNSFYLSRGNHEADDMNRAYGFEGEVKQKYSELTFKIFSEVFNGIPLGNLIMSKILVIHGGLFSKDGVTIDDLRAINRFHQPSNTGLMCELLWSDPQFQMGRAPSKRGIGIQFGPDVTKEFCDTNDLMMIVRSHELKNEGYEIMHDGKCVTIFSAPNYCGQSGNKGAFIHVDEFLNVSYKKFSAVSNPGMKQPLH